MGCDGWVGCEGGGVAGSQARDRCLGRNVGVEELWVEGRGVWVQVRPGVRTASEVWDPSACYCLAAGSEGSSYSSPAAPVWPSSVPPPSAEPLRPQLWRGWRPSRRPDQSPGLQQSPGRWRLASSLVEVSLGVVGVSPGAAGYLQGAWSDLSPSTSPGWRRHCWSQLTC